MYTIRLFVISIYSTTSVLFLSYMIIILNIKHLLMNSTNVYKILSNTMYSENCLIWYLCNLFPWTLRPLFLFSVSYFHCILLCLFYHTVFWQKTCLLVMVRLDRFHFWYHKMFDVFHNIESRHKQFACQMPICCTEHRQMYCGQCARYEWLNSTTFCPCPTWSVLYIN